MHEEDEDPTDDLERRVREAIRLRHFSRRTEKAYLSWIRRFVAFHQGGDPTTMGLREVSFFLRHLATKRGVAASTQNQALAALAFLFRDVLGREVDGLATLHRAKRPTRLPVVLSREEVRALLDELEGAPRVMAATMYSCGLRLMECCRLRVKDVDLRREQLCVRAGKGAKDRFVPLPRGLLPQLEEQLAATIELHGEDSRAGGGWVTVPEAFASKASTAGRALAWQWVFPGSRRWRHEMTGVLHRHHLHETVLQRHVPKAARAAGITKRVGCHTLRHSYATHLLEDGVDIRMIQRLLFFNDTATTEIYTHVLMETRGGLRAAVERLLDG
jgi:integron integrase